jgi:hypothetical protein
MLLRFRTIKRDGDTKLDGERIVPLRGVRCDVLAGRQLQHGRVLSFAQMRQQNDPPVRKLKRIMMNVRLVLVDLPEHSHSCPS